MPGQMHHFLSLPEDAGAAYGVKRYGAETLRLYGVLEKRLTESEYVAGDLSIADFAILGWAWRHSKHKVSLDAFPHVARWYQTLMDRPATKRGFSVGLT